MISTGCRRTAGVKGGYWIISASSSRSTPAPGVRARSVPTENAPRAVWGGTPPFERTSRHHCRAPRATLTPPVSNALLSAAGLLAKKLVGAAALITMLATNRALGILPAPRTKVEVVDELPDRFAHAQVLLAQPAERRVLRPRRIREAPIALSGRAVGLPGQDAERVRGQPARLPGHAARLGQRHGHTLQQQGRGRDADRLAGLDDAERLILAPGRPSGAHTGLPRSCAWLSTGV